MWFICNDAVDRLLELRRAQAEGRAYAERLAIERAEGRELAEQVEQALQIQPAPRLRIPRPACSVCRRISRALITAGTRLERAAILAGRPSQA